MIKSDTAILFLLGHRKQLNNFLDFLKNGPATPSSTINNEKKLIRAKDQFCDINNEKTKVTEGSDQDVRLQCLLESNANITAWCLTSIKHSTQLISCS